MTSLDRFPIIIKKFEELKKRWYDDKCDDSKLTDEQRIIKRLANDKLNEVDIKQINFFLTRDHRKKGQILLGSKYNKTIDFFKILTILTIFALFQ